MCTKDVGPPSPNCPIVNVEKTYLAFPKNINEHKKNTKLHPAIKINCT